MRVCGLELTSIFMQLLMEKEFKECILLFHLLTKKVMLHLLSKFKNLTKISPIKVIFLVSLRKIIKLEIMFYVMVLVEILNILEVVFFKLKIKFYHQKK